ncbi:MAG: tripartite tricarboxylate transporter permease [Candidatus Aenigmatarchaeota archaeon]
MINEILLSSFLGSFVGFVSGLIPALHQNLLIPLLIPLISFNEIFLISFLISFAISQNYGNAISSYYLSSPPEELSLSTLPSQRLAKEGLLLEALKIFILAASISIPITSFFILFLHSYISTFISSLERYIGLILIIALYTIFFFEENKLKSFFIFILSGIFGIYAFNIIDFNKAILAIFSGFFACTQIIINLFQKQNFLEYQEKDVKIKLSKKEILIGILLSLFVGIFSGLLPSLSVAQILLLFQPILNDRLFIFSSSASFFSNEIFSTTSLFTIENPRSGLSVYLEKVLGNVTYEIFVLFISIFLISSFFASMLFIFSYKSIMNLLKLINFKVLNVLVLSIIIAIVFVYSGFIGLLLLFISTSLGLITIFSNVNRSYLMGSIILSTILIYTNYYTKVLMFLGI